MGFWFHVKSGSLVVLPACVALTVGAAVPKALDCPLDYFKGTALHDADMRGISGKIDEILAQAPAEFEFARTLAKRREGHARNRIADRIEIATRLVHYVTDRHSPEADRRDYELLAYQGACELETIYGYFHAEAELEARRAALAPRRTYDFVRDFGGRGDGVTDNGPAFNRAFSALLESGGNATLTIPDGVFRVAPATSSHKGDAYAFPSWVKAGVRGETKSRPAKDFDGAVHLVATGLSHVTIRGSRRTEIRLSDPTMGGIAFLGCYDTVLKDVFFSYVGNCSTQGEVIDVDAEGEWMKMRRQKGYPDPSSDQFTKAKSFRFTCCRKPDNRFDSGSICICGGAQKIGDDVFKLVPREGASRGNWRKLVPGDRIAVIARYSEGVRGTLVLTDRCAFFGVEGVTVYDAPGQVFVLNGGYAPHLIGCSVRPRPGTDDLVSSNADGFINYGAFGVYAADSTFTRMEDDGCNVGYGGSATVKGLFNVDRADGRIVRVEFPDGRGVFRPEQRVREDPGKLAEFLRNISIGNYSAKCEACVEMAFPGNSGFVARNCAFYENRGMGLQAHAPNSLIENCTMQRLTGPAASINPLIGWGLVSNPHNTLVRNCRAVDCASGFVLSPGGVPKGIDCSQRMIQGIDIVDCSFGGFGERPIAESSASFDIGFDDVRFRLSVTPVTNGVARVISSDAARSIEARQEGDDTHRIVYSYASGPVRSVTVRMRTAADGARRFRLDADLEDGWMLDEADYPIVRVEATPGLNLMFGSTKGGYCTDMADKPQGWHYERTWPSQSVAQFQAVWDSERGTYVGVEDARGHVKQFIGDRTSRGVECFPRALVSVTNRYEQPYDIVMRRVRRPPGGEPLDWHDFAEIYRAWDVRQPWSRKRYCDRTDIPAWMKDAPIMTRFSRQWLDRPEDLRRFAAWWRSAFGTAPSIVAFWGWEKLGTWWGPDYFPCHPSDEAFGKIVGDLAADGFHVFTWPSGYNWCKVIGDRGDGTYDIDLRPAWIEPNVSHLVVNRDGSPYHRDAFWLRFGALTTVCGADAWTQDWWNGLTRELGRRGSDIVQVDQVVAGKLEDCWSTKHGHPAGRGPWMTEAFRSQLKSMVASLRTVRPEGIVGVEEPCEFYNDLVGIQDYRDLESDCDRFAPLYAYLYHDRVPVFQSNPYRDDPFSIAYQAVSGQIPFYRPDFAELDESRPALANGGFENLVDSVRGPSDWDRLIPARLLKGTDRRTALWNFRGANNMGWLGYGVTLDENERHSGRVSLKFDPPAAGGRDDGEPMQVSQTVTGLEPGEYELSAWVRNDAASAPRGSILMGTRAGGELTSVAIPSEAADWTRIASRVKLGNELRIIIWGPAGCRFHVDDLRLEKDGREVRFSGDSPYTVFMKRWIALYRGEGRDFLARGRAIRPPCVSCAKHRFAAREEDAVQVGAFESADGRRALFLANATDVQQHYSAAWNGEAVVGVLGPSDMRMVSNVPVDGAQAHSRTREERSDAEKAGAENFNQRTLEISGGTRGGLRLLVLGNSITLAAQHDEIGWPRSCGMAASVPERDFVHLLIGGLNARHAGGVEYRIKNIAAFERGWKGFDLGQYAPLVDFRPDILVVAIGENMANLKDDGAAFEAKLADLIGRFQRANPACKVVVRGVFWPNPQKDAALKAVARRLGCLWVDLSDFGGQDAYTARGQYSHRGVAAHPGDKGMSVIADRLLKALEPISEKRN